MRSSDRSPALFLFQRQNLISLDVIKCISESMHAKSTNYLFYTIFFITNPVFHFSLVFIRLGLLRKFNNVCLEVEKTLERIGFSKGVFVFPGPQPFAWLLALALAPGLGSRPWPSICIYRPWSPIRLYRPCPLVRFRFKGMQQYLPSVSTSLYFLPIINKNNRY